MAQKVNELTQRIENKLKRKDDSNAIQRLVLSTRLLIARTYWAPTTLRLLVGCSLTCLARTTLKMRWIYWLFFELMPNLALSRFNTSQPHTWLVITRVSPLPLNPGKLITRSTSKKSHPRLSPKNTTSTFDSDSKLCSNTAVARIRRALLINMRIYKDYQARARFTRFFFVTPNMHCLPYSYWATHYAYAAYHIQLLLCTLVYTLIFSQNKVINVGFYIDAGMWSCPIHEAWAISDGDCLQTLSCPVHIIHKNERLLLIHYSKRKKQGEQSLPSNSLYCISWSTPRAPRKNPTIVLIYGNWTNKTTTKNTPFRNRMGVWHK